MAMLGVGLTLNAAVIVANGGMPVAAQAVAAAKAVPLAAVPLAATDFVHVVASGATRLAWLADVIPLPGPAPIRATLSAGDCLLFAGVATFVAASTARLTPKRAGFTS
jgi:hypothetical protein